MSKQLERILICLLWLLAAALGSSFWLNTIFGFNIFSAPHWQYLAYLQAAQTPVRPAFYISLSACVIIALAGLYILMRPHEILRRRRMIKRAATQKADNAPAPDLPAAATTAQPAPTRPAAPVAPVNTRPARPISPYTSATPVMRATTPPTTAAPIGANTQNFDEIRDIFTAAGYLVKRSPQIGNFKPAVLAIGGEESLWIGGVGIGEAPLADAIARLDGIFSDTLEDIEIDIHGFIIAPSAPIASQDIQTFKTINELREYMSAHKNTSADDTDSKENFNAYSEYIDTVINYMDKI